MANDSNWWVAGCCGGLAFCLSLAAWAVRHGKAWALVFTGSVSLLLAMFFPVGTLLAYFLFKPLWECRKEFFPFAHRLRNVNNPLSSPEL
jgi:phage shock protein PspC (stress-responsive transcriptional regulator)